MTTLQTILNSVNELDAADKRVLRDVLNTQLATTAESHERDNGTVKPHPLIGLLADDPALADQILDSAMHARETRPLRVNGE